MLKILTKGETLQLFVTLVKANIFPNASDVSATILLCVRMQMFVIVWIKNPMCFNNLDITKINCAKASFSGN